MSDSHTTSGTVMAADLTPIFISEWVLTPDFVASPILPKLEVREFYTAYGVLVSESARLHSVECTCQLCGLCIEEGHPYNHQTLIGDLPLQTEQMLYCPFRSCLTHKGWDGIWTPRLFTRRSSLTQHLNRAHTVAGFPRSVRATSFASDAEAERLEALWNRSTETKDFDEGVAAQCLGERDLVSRLSSIYIALDLALDNPVLQRAVDAEIEYTMQHVLNYFVMSTLGEARYLSNAGHSRVHELARDLATLEKTEDWFTLWLAQHLYLRTSKRLGRHTVWRMALDLVDIVGYERLLLALISIFRFGVWEISTRVGGLKWASVARHGLKFVLREESPLVALDSIVDVVHNGGWALNKYYNQEHSCSQHTLPIGAALNIKHDNAMNLLALCCIQPWLKGALLSNDLTYTLTRHLPTPSAEAKWAASETRARFDAGLRFTVPPGTIADLESSGFWTPLEFLPWLETYGTDEHQAKYGRYGDGFEKAANTWQWLYRNPKQGEPRSPSLADFLTWFSAVSIAISTNIHGRYAGWNRFMVEVYAAYNTANEAEDAARALSKSSNYEATPVQQEAPPTPKAQRVPVESKVETVQLLSAEPDPFD